MSISADLGRALDYAVAHHHLLPTSVMVAAGLDHVQIRALCRTGVIERIIKGLYRLRGTSSPLQDVAAVLLRHAGAVASHVTALFVHGLDVEPPATPHFTLPPGSSSGTTLGILHRSPIDPVDVTKRHRLRVTTVARSIVDSAEQLSVDELAAVINEAVSRKMVTIRQTWDVHDRIEAAPGRIGSGRLRAALAPWTDEIQPDSPAEAAAIRRIVEYGLPRPVTQHVIEDEDGKFLGRVDLAWPEFQVLREYDSDRHHGPERIEKDELRRQKFEPHGWKVGGIRRQHLRPGQDAWLRKLGEQLAASRLRPGA